jgi:hypothetical protein
MPSNSVVEESSDRGSFPGSINRAIFWVSQRTSLLLYGRIIDTKSIAGVAAVLNVLFLSFPLPLERSCFAA